MYSKYERNGYIFGVGVNGKGTIITETEYLAILSAFANCPHTDGKGYRLKTDLTWESYDLPEPTPETDEITPEEIAEEIREVL